jgi:Uma2 family endonuclease
MATPALMTVEEFCQMGTADTEAYELVDGVLVALPSPSLLHGIIKDEVITQMNMYFRQNPLGGGVSETDCQIGRRTVRRPDYSVFLGERWQKLNRKKGPIPFAPDIAVEVLSPSEHAVAVTRRTREYLAAGSQQIWLIDPENGEINVRTKPVSAYCRKQTFWKHCSFLGFRLA